MPTLNDLLGRMVPGGAILIRGVSADTRTLQPGFLFAALPGSARDGRSFIAEAVAKGAVAILTPEGTPAAEGAAVTVTDPEPRRRFALIAARFFAAQPATLAAVTGTNGKTSVVTFTRQIWAAAGFSAASLGTLGLVAPDRTLKGTLTTPDPANLHRILAELAQAGVTHGAFEASSHGLDQYRLDGVAIKAAAFTNLTRDHLDYHGDMEDYRAAKRRLFAELLPKDGAAVLNADNEEGRALAQLCRDLGRKVATYGEAGTFVRIEKRMATPHGQDLTLAVDGKEYRLHLPLAGGFQAQNAACALALALVTGADRDKAVAALEKLEGVAGRMQLVGTTPEGAPAYVDYAHTPDALETVLSALRPHARGRLVVVFGCGGDRDPGKRPMMGRIASALADHVFVTDDNPRNEDPAAIRAQILAACHGAAEIGPRHDAIQAAVASLEEGDVLVVAGKGHESGQIVKDQILPFDDAAEIRAALEGRR